MPKSFRIFCYYVFPQAILEWTSYNEEKRKQYLLSFLQKVSLDEVLPQVLIEVIQHPVVSSNSSVEKLIRDTLTTVLSKKFDSMEPKEEGVEESEFSPSQVPSRCFYQQDVRKC